MTENSENLKIELLSKEIELLKKAVLKNGEEDGILKGSKREIYELKIKNDELIRKNRKFKEICDYQWKKLRHGKVDFDFELKREKTGRKTEKNGRNSTGENGDGNFEEKSENRGIKWGD